MSAPGPAPFDPLRILEALERHRVAYVVVGALAGVIHGTDEVTSGLDICPQMRPANVERLGSALAELDAQPPPGGKLEFGIDLLERSPVTTIATEAGEVKLVPIPTGTAGYDDLRRAASREPLGQGVRSSVASVGDLGRMLAAFGRSGDAERLELIRHIGDRDYGRGTGGRG